MEKETAKQRIERLKIKANLFLKNNTRCFLKDFYDNYYFCFILSSNEDNLIIKNFAGKRFNEGKKIEKLNWVDILDIQEYKEREDLS